MSTKQAGSCVLLGVAAVVLSWLMSGTATALPAGRYWIPTDTTQVPGHTRLLPHRLDLDSLGCPVLYASAVGGIGSDFTAMSWRDSAWAQRWNLGYEVAFSWPVGEPIGRHTLIWQAYGPEGLAVASPQLLDGYLVMSEDLGDTYAPPDTVAAVDAYSFLYSGAVSSRWRWAAKADWSLGMRLFSSRDHGPWKEYRLDSSTWNSAFTSVGVQALNDSSALVAWARDGSYRLQWGVLSGDTWERRPMPWLAVGGLSQGLALRRGAGNGVWAGWADHDPGAVISRLEGDTWAPPESLQCAYRLSGIWHSAGVYLSRDTLSHPVVSWLSWNERAGSMYTLCLCVPDESGKYGVAENLEGTDGIAQADVIRDANEDVWVVWWNEELEGMFWTHSAVRATAVNLRVERNGQGPGRPEPWGRRRVLRWELSEAAPGSYWTVERASLDGPFEVVARLRAGEAPALRWEDPEPTSQPVRYRIRRESVDRRYEWVSGELGWPAWVGQRFRALPPRVGLTGPLEFTVEGAAAGPLQVRLYDVQGRLVSRQEATALGQGRDVVRLGTPALSSGVYFVALRDASGAESESTKFVVLR